MFIIRGSFRWDNGEVPLAELALLASQVRERHHGNLAYAFSVDAGDPRLIYLNEAWEQESDFDAHGQTPEVAAIGAVAARGATEVRIDGYSATHARQVLPRP